MSLVWPNVKACEENFPEWGYDSRARIGGQVGGFPYRQNIFLLEGRVAAGTDRGPVPRVKHVIMTRTSVYSRWRCDLGKGGVSVMMSVVLLF